MSGLGKVHVSPGQHYPGLTGHRKNTTISEAYQRCRPTYSATRHIGPIGR